MTELLGYILLFTAVGFGFIFVHLVVGKFIRPAKPSPEKMTIYECGEPTIGSSWIQFDLRFYVVALLFVIFDVEVVFFFPWAVVFGKLNFLGDPRLTVEERVAVTQALDPNAPADGERLKQALMKNVRPGLNAEALERLRKEELEEWKKVWEELREEAVERQVSDANGLAMLAVIDIGIFFGVLLVGFAYLWRRGDLDWVRSTVTERPAVEMAAPAVAPSPPLVGAGRETSIGNL